MAKWAIIGYHVLHRKVNEAEEDEGAAEITEAQAEVDEVVSGQIGEGDRPIKGKLVTTRQVPNHTIITTQLDTQHVVGAEQAR